MLRLSRRAFTAGLIGLGLTMLLAMTREREVPLRRRFIRRMGRMIAMMGRGMKAGGSVMGTIGDVMMRRLRV